MDLDSDESEPRSERFDRDQEPFRTNPALRINTDAVTGPIRFLNPTLASFNYIGSAVHRIDSEGSEYIERESEQAWDNGVFAKTVEYAWSSRNNRKGRHALVIREYWPGKQRPTSQLTGPRAVVPGIRRMFMTFPFRDVSFINAIAFVVGCVTLVANAFLSFLPMVQQKFQSPRGLIYLQAALSFLGSACFVCASSLAFLEAINAQKGGCFGWKAQQLSYADSDDTNVEAEFITRLTPDGQCEHHHSSTRRAFGYTKASEDEERGVEHDEEDVWVWFPTPREFRTLFVYEIG
jgi:hypothetical protein